MRSNTIPQKFYKRDTSLVAKELLGKLLVRKINKHILISKIVETEAYYGLKDPCSRAKTTPKMAQPMWEDPGKIFTYMVHNNWMFNIVTESKGIPAAVLIRAIEPVSEIELMKKYRGKSNYDLTNGPGKLSAALKIGKKHNLNEIFLPWSDIKIIKLPIKDKIKISSSNRVGVRYDLKKKLRFFIKDNPWVSKGKIYGELK